MAFCKACGQDIGTSAFCPKCGTNQSSAAPAPAAAPAAAPSTEGLAENVAGLLCYAVGWVTGIIFLLIDKRPWVKFQAAQSIAVFGLIGLVGFVLWIFLMVKAYQHENVRIPIAADIADSLAGK